EVNWQRSLARAGELVRTTLQQDPEKAQNRVEEAARASLATAGVKLREAARLARQVEGSMVGAPRLSADPVGALRNLQMHDLLCWQAHRSYLDFWAAQTPGPGVPPYYRAAGGVFLDDAAA